MEQARLMNLDKDYENLGLSKKQIEMWEDGKRANFDAGTFEWWYFDSILDDGSKIAACYCTKIQPFTNLKGLKPCLTVHITTPDGKQLARKYMNFKKDEIILGTDKCDVQFGENCFVGDLKNYHIKAVPNKGLGFDITLKSTTSPWRGETGYLGFGNNDEKYFTWLCVVPSGIVEGTLTIDGVEHKVKGTGYHDHQWGNTIQYEFLNHWLWARHKTENYNILVFDFILNEYYGHKRIPLVFVEDKNGNVIFESTDNVKCEIKEEFLQESSQTNFPKITHYIFESNGKKIDYTLTVKQELDDRYIYKELPFIFRPMFKGTKPKYGRYLAEGVLTMYDGDKQLFSEVSDFIYEFAYIGEEYKKYAEIDLNQ